MGRWLVGRLARYMMEWQSAEAFDDHPVVLNLPVTDNCNARCVMCDVWKNPAESDFTAAELRQWVRRGLLNDVAHVGLSGGEPTLRKDLPELFEILCGELPRIRSISVTTHGFHPKRWEWMAPRIRDTTRRYGVPFRGNVSVDGIGKVHERVRRIPGGFDKVEQTLDVFKRAGVSTQLQCTVSRLNVYHVGETLEYARRKGLDVVFRVATEIARLENLSSVSKVVLSEDERSFFADFLVSDKLLAVTRNPARRLFYRDLATRLETGASRGAPCSFQRRGAMLSATGDIYQCSVAQEPLGSLRHGGEFDWSQGPIAAARKAFVDTVCPSCLHDQTGHWHPASLLAEVLRRSPGGRSFDRLHRGASIIRLALRLRDGRSSDNRLPGAGAGSKRSRALLVGAYGGEHVGDAAILAGVCQRLHESEGVDDFTVVSFRAGRTARWLRSVRIPDGCKGRVISIEDLTSDDFGEVVCYAGGPLMDLPLMNLRAALILHQAKLMGCKIRLEGVGIGPFRRRLGVASVKGILQAADKVSVRTPQDARLASELGRTPDHISDDPAEDYIRSGLWRGSSTPQEREEIHDAYEIAGQSGKVIAWNLRPLSWVYAKAGHSVEETQDAVREQVATAIERLPQYHHILFSMNADQYGDSDLDEMRTIVNRLEGRHVWMFARELGVGGMLEFLERADAIVAMRFHACVFGTALGRPVIAIDYGIGEDQKVSRFMRKTGRSGLCQRVDLVSAEWLVRQVVGAVEQAPELTPAS